MEPPEVQTMTPEVQALLMDETDPGACTCEHNGLPVAWHRSFCDLSARPTHH